MNGRRKSKTERIAPRPAKPLLARVTDWWSGLKIENKIAIISLFFTVTIGMSDLPVWWRWIFPPPLPNVTISCLQSTRPPEGGAHISLIKPEHVPQGTQIKRAGFIVANVGNADAGKLSVLLQVTPFQVSAVEIQSLNIARSDGTPPIGVEPIPFVDLPLIHEAGFQLPSLKPKDSLFLTVNYLTSLRSPPQGFIMITLEAGGRIDRASLNIAGGAATCAGLP